MARLLIYIWGMMILGVALVLMSIFAVPASIGFILVKGLEITLLYLIINFFVKVCTKKDIPQLLSIMKRHIDEIEDNYR